MTGTDEEASGGKDRKIHPLLFKDTSQEERSSKRKKELKEEIREKKGKKREKKDKNFFPSPYSGMISRARQPEKQSEKGHKHRARGKSQGSGDVNLLAVFGKEPAHPVSCQQPHEVCHGPGKPHQRNHLYQVDKAA